jgi:hypothetical protein
MATYNTGITTCVLTSPMVNVTPRTAVSIEKPLDGSMSRAGGAI